MTRQSGSARRTVRLHPGTGQPDRDSATDRSTRTRTGERSHRCSGKGGTMQSTRMAKTAAVILVAGVAVVASSISSAATGSAKVVTISVASLIPGSTPQAQAQFNAQVQEFQKAHPTIKVNSVEYQWTRPAFAAKLAAGTLPTVFEGPFTDARALRRKARL